MSSKMTKYLVGGAVVAALAVVVVWAISRGGAADDKSQPSATSNPGAAKSALRQTAARNARGARPTAGPAGLSSAARARADGPAQVDDPELAKVANLAEFKVAFNKLLLTRDESHAEQALQIAGRLAAALQGTAEWPEAMLYLGLAQEAAANYGDDPEGYARIQEIYNRALAADPPPANVVAMKLQYRAALYDVVGEWEKTKDPEAFRTATKAIIRKLEQVAMGSPWDVKTSSGLALSQAAKLVLDACIAPGGMNDVRAKAELASDLLAWPTGQELRGSYQQSIRDYVEGPGAADYEKFMVDPVVRPEERAVLESQLAEYYMTHGDTPVKALDHATRIVSLPVSDEVKDRARAQIAEIRFQLGEIVMARGLAFELRQSPVFATLPAQTQQTLQTILDTPEPSE